MNSPSTFTGWSQNELAEWRERVLKVESETGSAGHPLVHRANFDKFVLTRSAATWHQVQYWFSQLPGKWAFRGQNDATWRLATSLERATTLTVKVGENTGDMLLDPSFNEQNLLAEFQRRSKQYLKHLPDESDTLSWLSLMQHYGAPTRLLDWTYSPYVGLFFAVQRLILNDDGAPKPSGLWAIDLSRLQQAGWSRVGDKLQGIFQAPTLRSRCEQMNGAIFSPSSPSVVILADPLSLDERMAAQQSTFLYALGSNFNFDIVLLGMISSTLDSPIVQKLEIAASARIEILSELEKANITAASLFPGLDGFARSLGDRLEISVNRFANMIG